MFRNEFRKQPSPAVWCLLDYALRDPRYTLAYVDISRVVAVPLYVDISRVVVVPSM